MMCTERYFDARVFSSYLSVLSVSFDSERNALSMRLANPDYCDFASRKIKVNEIV